MAISTIRNEFMDQKLLENLQFSWDQVFIMPSLMLFIKQDKQNRHDFNKNRQRFNFAYRIWAILHGSFDIGDSDSICEYCEIKIVAKRYGTNSWYEFAANMRQNF